MWVGSIIDESMSTDATRRRLGRLRVRSVRHPGQSGCCVAGLERAGHAVGCLADRSGARSADAAVDDIRRRRIAPADPSSGRTARSSVCATTTVGSTCGSAIDRWSTSRSNTAARVGGWASDRSLCRPTGAELRSPATKLGSEGCASSTSPRARCQEVARGVHGQLSWQGGRLCALRSGARTPTQVVVYDDTTWERTVLAVGPLSGWEHLPLGEPEVIEVCAADGATLHARLYRADASDRSPALLVARRPDRSVAGHVHAADRLLAGAGMERAGAGPSRFDRSRPRSTSKRCADDGATSMSPTRSISITHAHAQGWGSPAHTAIVGSSAGGFTALGVAARRPQSDGRRHRRLSGHRPRPTSPSAVIGSSVTTPTRWSGPLPDAAVAVHRSFAAALRRNDWPSTPLLVMHGDSDPVVPDRAEPGVRRALSGGRGDRRATSSTKGRVTAFAGRRISSMSTAACRTFWPCHVLGG